jgi:hypothetical protein
MKHIYLHRYKTFACFAASVPANVRGRTAEWQQAQYGRIDFAVRACFETANRQNTFGSHYGTICTVQNVLQRLSNARPLDTSYYIVMSADVKLAVHMVQYVSYKMYCNASPRPFSVSLPP